MIKEFVTEKGKKSTTDLHGRTRMQSNPFKIHVDP
jgi:hypothetical protein